MHPLKPLTKKGRGLGKFLVCDIEARDWVRFVVIGLYDGEKFMTFNRLKKFIDYLFQYEEKHGKITVYAHFGGKYDFNFILHEVAGKDKYYIDKMIAHGSGLLCFELLNLDTTQNITFFDSSKTLPFGLASLCENFNVTHKKLEFDYSKIKKASKKLVKYLEHDCKGLYEVLHKYRSWPLIQRAGAKNTMAAQSLQVLRLFLKEEIWPLKDEEDEFVRRSYFGGRTEIFKPYYNGKKPLYCYDVNSLYPTVMRENDFPTQFLGYTTTYSPKKMGFYDATVEVPKDLYVPPLGIVYEVNKTKKFIFPTGKFSGRWSTIELEYARSLGVKILKTGKGILFRNGGPIFREYIDTLYEMRLKADKNSVDNVLTKLLMNSCYGRFGLQRDRENLVFDDGVVEGAPHSEIKTPEGLMRLMKVETKLDSFSNVAVAAWVTSLARIHMHKIYMQCKDELYYTDTDSIFTTKEFESSSELGGLKQEYVGKRACFLLPKTYIVDEIFGLFNKEGKELNKKVVMKGFERRKIANFQIEDFFSALEGDFRRLRTTVEPKFATLKTALRKGKLLAMTEKSSREIRSQYDKRSLFKQKVNGIPYNTKPLHIKV